MAASEPNSGDSTTAPLDGHTVLDSSAIIPGRLRPGLVRTHSSPFSDRFARSGRTHFNFISPGAPAGSLRRFPEAVDELKEVGSGRVRTLTGEFACLETRCASATIRHPWDRSHARSDVSRGTRQRGRLRCGHLQIATDQTRYRRSTVSYRLRVRHDTTYMAAH